MRRTVKHHASTSLVLMPGVHGDAANETIEFDEFLVALGMCGAFKYAESGMSIPQRVEYTCSGLANRSQPRRRER